MEELENKTAWDDLFTKMDPLNVYIPIRMKNWLINKFNPPTKKNNKSPKMKGTLLKKENEWVVTYEDLVTVYPLSYYTNKEIKIHPDNSLLIGIAYTDSFKTEVEFEIVDHPEITGVRVAKLDVIERTKELNDECIKKIISEENHDNVQMEGELYKSDSGLWVVWYQLDDGEKFECGKIPLHPDLQKKMEGLDSFIESLIEGSEVDFLIVRDGRLCSEFMTYDYAKITSEKKEEK